MILKDQLLHSTKYNHSMCQLIIQLKAKTKKRKEPFYQYNINIQNNKRDFNDIPFIFKPR